MGKYFKYSILILPVVFIIFGAGFHRAKYANDPDYIYLMNAVAICKGQSVGHIDNPGTTVMQLDAATFIVKHLMHNSGSEKLVNDILLHPDDYIEATRKVLLILNFIIILLVGFVTLKKTGSVWMALLLQLTAFLTSNTLDHIWTKVSPEPLLFFITQIFVIVVLYYYSDKNKQHWKYVVFFALIMGAGLGTKATFLPLTVFAFFILPGIKRKLIYSLSVILSFILFTIPAIPEYKSMYYWFRSLIRHTGQYGHGEKGIIDPSSYFPNISKIIEANPVFSAVFFLGVLTIILKFVQHNREKRKLIFDWNTRILVGLLTSMLLGILLVAKHYHNANHYLIPELLLTGIVLFFILNSGILTIVTPYLKKAVYPGVVLILGFFLAWQVPPDMKYADYGYKITNEEMDTTNIMISQKYPGYTKIYYYPSLYKYSALNFGDVYTKRKILPDLKKLYPDIYLYDYWLNMMQYWNAQISIEDIIQFNGYKILMVGGPRSEDKLPELESRGLPFKKIYNGRIQAIYELDSVKYKNTRATNIPVLINKTTCGGELVSSDEEKLIGTNNDFFGSAYCRSDEESRSGKYAFKLDDKHEFAVEFIIDSISPGNIFEVKAWRKSNNFDGILVVSSVKPNLFYKAQNDYIRSDKNGWDLLKIKFTANENLANEPLKVYFWNKGDNIVWFDDLSIETYSPTNIPDPKNDN